MTHLKLWGRLSSINVQKVVWALDELHLRYERVDAGGAFGIVNTPEYRRMNPNGLVPVLEESDGFSLFESNAIIRYLVARHPGSTLLPADLRMRADAERWMDWQATTATPALRDVFWQLVRTKPEARDASVIAQSTGASAAMAHIIDARLADRPYLAGDSFSMGDIPLGCHVKRWLALPIERPSLPNLEAWFARISERPGARVVMAVPLS
ncbi:glutathione S-transferase family protein [uncultured Enterovirga sp.]|uniref:glutathione S-transferase family protein n=1 Tax=uncultured Enterovirga sp. TaxID=2026352 RepID=UPI0035CC5946